MLSTKETLQHLRAKILEFNAAYEKGTPLVEDYVYDFYKKRLKILESTEQDKISEKIGPAAKDKVKHLHKILSLEHDFGIESFEKFLTKIQKKTDVFPLIAELKIDGVSIVARYINGYLQHIATRGDGTAGENITHLKDYLHLPNEIYIKDTIDIRFEAYIDKHLIANPRNAVAGMLMKKEADENLRHIQFAPHNLYSETKIWLSYIQLREIFEQMHLTPITPFQVCNSIEDMQTFFEKIEAEKDDLPFEIDGVVFKINDKEAQEKLGNTAIAPRYAFAVKFENASAVSIIQNIQFQVGRFGKITPVAEIEETIIKGRKIKRATLNNFEYLTKQQYAIGDVVKIEMAGEVIPMISEIIEKSGLKITLPTTCPSCNAQLNDDTCEAGWQCYMQRKERLCYFASKNGLNIQGMGDKQIEFFMESNMLQYPYNFFDLKNNVNKILYTPTWLGEKSLSNLLEAIEKARYVSLENWYISLGLPHIGKVKAQILAEKYPNFEDFLNASIEDLQELGPEIAKDVHEYKAQEKWMLQTWQHMQIGKEYTSDSITLF